MRARLISVLAIDPGTRHLGYASFERDALEDYGARDLRLVSGADDVFAAAGIVVNRLIDQKRPRVLVIEKNNFSQSRQNLRLALLIGKVRHIARKHRTRVFEFDPRTVRKIVCRDGNADSRELARTVAVRYPEMRVYLESNRVWRVRYFQNAIDAIACGMAFLATSGTLTHRTSRSAGREELAQ